MTLSDIWEVKLKAQNIGLPLGDTRKGSQQVAHGTVWENDSLTL